MKVVAAILSFGLLLIGLLVFVVIARPRLLFGWMAWWVGEAEAWRDGQTTREDEDRYHRMLNKLQPVLLLLVFAWAFVVGSVVALGRL